MTFPAAYAYSQRLAIGEKLRLSAQALERELFHYWLKVLFFGGFVGLAFMGYAVAGLAHMPLAQVFAASAGLFIAICWTVALTAARYWQSVWEARVRLLEDYTVGPLFKIDEGMGQRNPTKTGMNFSIHVLMMAFAFVVAAAFGGLLLYAVADLRGLGTWRVLLGILVVACFAGASYVALRLSRSGARARPFGLQDNVLYLDLP